MSTHLTSQTLRDGAARLGITLDDAQLGAFRIYRDELLAWNTQRANLTSITDPQEVERLLFLESLAITLALPEGLRSKGGSSLQNARLLDVGSGAGIPGLPLKIAYPELQVTLLEATGKKTRFLEHVVKVLELEDGVSVVNARAEDAARESEHRGTYDYVTARAVGSLRVLVELCLPFARIGGLVIAPKSVDADREVEEAQHALEVLGGRVHDVLTVDVPGLPPDRRIVVVEKTTQTPVEYPRRSGTPAKRPL